MNSQNDDEQTGREEQRWEHLTAVSLSANSRKEKSAQYLSESRTLRLMSRFLPVTYSSLSRPHIHNTYVSESQDGNTNVKGVDNANRSLVYKHTIIRTLQIEIILHSKLRCPC